MKKHMSKLIRTPNLPRKQSGYILVVTVILLSVLLILSLNFLERTSDSLKISGYNRESAESLVLAENALNMLYGLYIYNENLDGDDDNDNDERINLGKLDELPLPYLYYTSNDTEIDQKTPGVLQKVANGEAKGSSNNINNHIVNINTPGLLVSDLYTAKTHPIVFVINQNNQLEISNTPWSEVINNNNFAAAAWFELVRNEDLAGTAQVYVQAVGKVGKSKSYLQRLIGNFPTTLGTDLKTLAESSPDE